MGTTSGKRKQAPTTSASLSSSSKKKAKKSASGSKNKAVVYQDVAAQNLPWKRLKNVAYDFGEDGGVLELEEIDDVDVVWEETAGGGKTAKFRMPEDKVVEPQDNDDDDLEFEGFADEEWTGIPDQDGLANQDLDQAETDEASLPPVPSTSAAVPNLPERPSLDYDEVPFDDTLLPGFTDLPLLPSLKRALLAAGFTKPSDIQEKTLAEVLTRDSVKSRDIVGVAETGSGKTLAYSLPILQEILSDKETVNMKKRPLTALILCPTRELALQVRQHVGDIVFKASIPPNELASDSDKPSKPIPRINIATICGGMSIQKQQRILSSSYGVDIIVATPGRLWEMLQEDENLAKSVKRIKFLVLDEADRMIETGHYAELENIVALTRRQPGEKKGDGETKFVNDFENAEDSLEACPVREIINTYVFSATMSKELQKNVKKFGRRKFIVSEEEKGKMGALGSLIAKLDFRDDDPFIINLSTEGGLVKLLKEVKVDCLLKEKDIYLYYFLLRYPGRTLVFLSSIDAMRRLRPLLELLGLRPATLHSAMQQRARLKALDRFKSAKSMILLATDVAARGLDITAVEHVVHYQLPRTADTYIHRSGRTARAGKEGIALQLCSPEEKATQKALMKSLGRETKMQDLQVEYSIFNRLKERVELAREIDQAKHKADKAEHDEDWLKKAAKEMDLDMSDTDGDSDGGRGLSKHKSRRAKGKEEELKAKLRHMLKQPLMLKGLSAKYITSGGSADFAKEMLAGLNHQSMLGLPQSRAVDDLK